MAAPPLPFRVMARTYSMTFTARPQDIDELGHVNNSVWVQWMERIATEHWRSHADPADVADYLWVVSRHEIDFRGNIGCGETAISRTWIATPPKGARFDRTIQFVDESGRAIVTAQTTWVIIDAETHRPVRVPRRIADHFLIEEQCE